MLFPLKLYSVLSAPPLLLGDFAQELFPSSNLNICIRQPDGSYTGDSLDSPKGNLDENVEKISPWTES